MCACGSPLFWNSIVYMAGNFENKICVRISSM
jgi:hypothetical protein